MLINHQIYYKVDLQELKFIEHRHINVEPGQWGVAICSFDLGTRLWWGNQNAYPWSYDKSRSRGCCEM